MDYSLPSHQQKSREKIRLVSRDENLLFYSVTDTSSITNNIHRVQNRVVYKNVRLKITLEKTKCPRETLVSEAVVDWYNCHISVFLTDDDKINNIPCYVGYFTIPPSKETQLFLDDGSLFQQLLVECFQFLKRGHSLFHIDCKCDKKQHVFFCGNYYSSCQKKRYSDLGFNNSNNESTIRQKGCKARSDRQMQSLDAIAKELGIINIYTGHINVCLETTPLSIEKRERKVINMKFVQALSRYGQFEQHHEGGNIYLSSNICCIPRTISCVRDIMHAMKVMDPEPFRWILTSCKTATTEHLMQDQILNQINLCKSQQMFRIVEEYDERDSPHHNRSDSKKKRKYEEENTKRRRPIAITFYSMNKDIDKKQQQTDEDIRKLWRTTDISKHSYRNFY